MQRTGLHRRRCSVARRRLFRVTSASHARLQHDAVRANAVQGSRAARRTTIRPTPPYLDVVIRQAALLAHDGRGERAVELAALALHHPASNVEVRRRARALLDQLGTELPPAACAAGQERGQSRDLEATVGQLLAVWKR